MQALNDEVFLQRLKDHGIKQAQKFSWDVTSTKAIEAWEKIQTDKLQDQWYRSRPTARIYQDLAKVLEKASNSLILNIAVSLSQNQQNGLTRQLFLDVSELSQRDSETGVQRVVRSYLKWLIQSPPQAFCVEPVFATREQGYCYARSFTKRFLGHSEKNEQDSPIRWQRGDIFFGLDMQHHVQLAHQDFFYRLKQEGVTVKFEVYDLLPVQLSDYFKDANSKELHEQWLAMIAGLDGAICVSKATTEEFERWVSEKGITRSPTFHISWVHNGADMECEHPSQGLPEAAKSLLKTFKQFTFTNDDSGSGVFGLEGISGSFHNFQTGSAASQSFGVFNEDSQSQGKHYTTFYSDGTFYKIPLYYQIRNCYYQYDRVPNPFYRDLRIRNFFIQHLLFDFRCQNSGCHN